MGWLGDWLRSGRPRSDERRRPSEPAPLPIPPLSGETSASPGTSPNGAASSGTGAAGAAAAVGGAVLLGVELGRTHGSEAATDVDAPTDPADADDGGDPADDGGDGGDGDGGDGGDAGD